MNGFGMLPLEGSPHKFPLCREVFKMILRSRFIRIPALRFSRNQYAAERKFPVSTGECLCKGKIRKAGCSVPAPGRCYQCLNERRKK